jgi:hypothetical protein
MADETSREPAWEHDPQSPWAPRAQYHTAPQPDQPAPQPSQYPASPYPASPYQTVQHPAWQYPAMGVNPAMRAATADRERAVDVLRAGFTEGRLTQAEYNHRMGRAYEARTYGELMALTADLPAGPLPVPPMLPPVWQPAPPIRNNSMATAALILGGLEFFTGGLTAIPAIICGHIARGQIKRTGEDGNGMAVAGLVLGYLAVAFVALLITIALIAVNHSGAASPN